MHYDNNIVMSGLIKVAIDHAYISVFSVNNGKLLNIVASSFLHNIASLLPVMCPTYSDAKAIVVE
jgi:hypothetical protein